MSRNDQWEGYKAGFQTSPSDESLKTPSWEKSCLSPEKKLTGLINGFTHNVLMNEYIYSIVENCMKREIKLRKRLREWLIRSLLLEVVSKVACVIGSYVKGCVRDWKLRKRLRELLEVA
jgi:hypothetical protein